MGDAQPVRDAQSKRHRAQPRRHGKCSYCVQRINAVKIETEKEDRTVRDVKSSPLPANPAVRSDRFREHQ